MKKFSITAIMLFFGREFSFAADADSLSVKIDSSILRQRAFAEKLSEKYSGDEFDYSSVEGEAQNFLSQAINWFFRKLGEIFGFELSPEVYQIIEIIVYMVLGALVLYLIVRFLVGTSANAMFSRKSGELSSLNISEEHIDAVDLDKFIKDALAQKNYRLAIRFMYLKILKELSGKQLIEWHFDKTNLDYYHELTDSPLKSSFKQVSYLYDYIWYGEFVLDEDGFTAAKKDFDRLTKTISNAR